MWVIIRSIWVHLYALKIGSKLCNRTILGLKIIFTLKERRSHSDFGMLKKHEGKMVSTRAFLLSFFTKDLVVDYTEPFEWVAEESWHFLWVTLVQPQIGLIYVHWGRRTAELWMSWSVKEKVNAMHWKMEPKFFSKGEPFCVPIHFKIATTY